MLEIARILLVLPGLHLTLYQLGGLVEDLLNALLSLRLALLLPFLQLLARICVFMLIECRLLVVLGLISIILIGERIESFVLLHIHKGWLLSVRLVILSPELSLNLADLSLDLSLHLVDPGMGEYLLDAWPLLSLKLQNVDNQVLQILVESVTQLVVAQLDLLLHLVKVFSREGRVSMQKLIEEHAHRPDVYRVVVLLLKHHLWCHVLVCPAECLAFEQDIVSGPSQIADLHVTTIIQQNVLRLHYCLFTLRSLCMMSFSCRYLIALRVWLKNLNTSASEMVGCLFW